MNFLPYANLLEQVFVVLLQLSHQSVKSMITVKKFVFQVVWMKSDLFLKNFMKL